MKSLVAVLVTIAFLQGCARSNAAPQQSTDVQTIDSADLRPAPMQPPPVLTDEGPAPKPKTDVMSPDAPPPPTAADEAMRAALPFAPAIALDPVSGVKISIRSNTLTYEFKGRIFYFSSEDSRRTFIASPLEYTKGVFSLPKP